MIVTIWSWKLTLLVMTLIISDYNGHNVRLVRTAGHLVFIVWITLIKIITPLDTGRGWWLDRALLGPAIIAVNLEPFLTGRCHSPGDTLNGAEINKETSTSTPYPALCIQHSVSSTLASTNYLYLDTACGGGWRQLRPRPATRSPHTRQNT